MAEQASPGKVPDLPGSDDVRMAAAAELLGHTGVTDFKLWYCVEQLPPVTWIAACRWERPGQQWEAAAALHPLLAVFRLCDAVLDGGQCLHCGRPTGFTPDFDPMPLSDLVCWYQWDPELEVFRRSCADGIAAGDGK